MTLALLLTLGLALPSNEPTPELQVAAPSDERRWTVQPLFTAHLFSGAEWDTNARRAVSTNVATTLPTVVIGDAVARLLLDSSLALAITNQDRLDLRLVLGAKRFFKEATEDLLIPELSAASSHRLAPNLNLELDGSWRASRIRSGVRDYTLGIGDAGLAWAVDKKLVARVRGGWVDFDFGQDRTLAYRGPSVGGELVWDPLEHLTLRGEAINFWRAYHGNAIAIDPNDPTQEILTSNPRHDTEFFGILRASYHTSFEIGAELLTRFQRSNSALEALDRYRVAVYATFSLPLGLLASAMGALQFNRGLSVTQTQVLGVEDDENFNRLELQLGKKLSGGLTAEIRYSLYANEFATVDVHYFRQTFYAGLSYELDGTE